jgi:hypothetical protein
VSTSIGAQGSVAGPHVGIHLLVAVFVVLVSSIHAVAREGQKGADKAAPRVHRGARFAHGPRVTRPALSMASLADDEEVTVVLAVNLAVGAKRDRRPRGTERKLLKDRLPQSAALVDSV